MLPVTYR